MTDMMKDKVVVTGSGGGIGGALARVRADEPGSIALKALMERNPGVDSAAIDDVICGCANQAGANLNVAFPIWNTIGVRESSKVFGTKMNSYRR